MVASRFARIAVALLALAGLALPAASAQEGEDIPVRKTPRLFESKISKSHNYMAWSQIARRRPTRGNVFAKTDGSRAFRVDTTGAETAMGSLDGNRLIYQRFRKNTSNIVVVNLKTGRSHPVAAVNTKKWEYRPRADGPWIMFARRVAGDRQRLLLVNTSTGSSRVLDELGPDDYLLPGQVNGDYVVWNVRTTGNTKVKRHRISTGNTIVLPTGGRHNWGPSVTDSGITYFGRSNNRCGGDAGLFRATLQGEVRKLVAFPARRDMSTSWAYETRDGQIEIYHDRGPCKAGEVAEPDIYKVVDPYS